ncbi:MAG: hypothetical protein M3065_15610 [Actinomycetota bacterium]|nr:hypothetical protein [Actinomycetota bacterium]
MSRGFASRRLDVNVGRWRRECNLDLGRGLGCGNPNLWGLLGRSALNFARVGAVVDG